MLNYDNYVFLQALEVNKRLNCLVEPVWEAEVKLVYNI